MKKALLFILLSVAAVGCHKSDIIEPDEPQGDPVAVDFAFSGLRAGAVPASRAEGDIEAEELAVNTTVRVLVFQRTGSVAAIASDKFFAEATYIVREIDGVRTLVPCNVDSDGKEDLANAAAPAEIRLRAAKYDFYAFTPAAPIDPSTWEVTVDYGVDHASSLTEQVAVGPSYVNAATRKQSVTLNTLLRRCSQLSFAVERKSENVNKITIKSATLSKIPGSPITKVLCTAFPLRTSTGGEYTLPSGIFKPVDGKNYKLAGKDVVLPKGDTEFKLEMTVNFNDSNVDKEVSATIPHMAFQPNTQYCFVITLKGGSFSLTLNILPWDTEYSSDLHLGDFHYGSVDLGSWSLDNDLGFNIGAF
ncbi:MAG: hypothetical protein K2I85_04245 [Alistipes sp.]|nr:hypothetical protein [Alistipes sp.]